MDVEDIYQALFDLAAGLAWPGGALAFASRRVKTFEDLPDQPALCQAETDETVTQVTSLQSITTLGASWLLYHQAGKDDDAIPAQTTNAILTAVNRCLSTRPTQPSPDPRRRGPQVLDRRPHPEIPGRPRRPDPDRRPDQILVP